MYPGAYTCIMLNKYMSACCQVYLIITFLSATNHLNLLRCTTTETCMYTKYTCMQTIQQLYTSKHETAIKKVMKIEMLHNIKKR